MEYLLEHHSDLMDSYCVHRPEGYDRTGAEPRELEHLAKVEALISDLDLALGRMIPETIVMELEREAEKLRTDGYDDQASGFNLAAHILREHNKNSRE